jgi:hypothetical protein
MLPDSPAGIEDDSRLAGAPANEIEITPEMIEAGAEVILESMFRWQSIVMDEPAAYSISEKVCAAVCARYGK